MPFQTSLKNKVLTGQSREIISNLLNFMQAEAVAGEVSIPLEKVQERVAAATGVSIRSIRRIKKEATLVTSGQSTSFSTPKRTNKNTKIKIRLDDADLGILRRTIINHHFTEKTVPRLKTVHAKYIADTGYQGCKKTLHKEMHKIGFRWKKCRSNQRVLMEQQPIRLLRIEFLKKMRQYREEGRNIVYMDETYIHSTHTHLKGWSDNSLEGIKKPTGQGPRLIIVHAGGEDSFVPNAYIRWKSNSTSGDYHHDMNYDNYKKRVSDNLIPNLKQRSVVVIDNAPYDNKKIDKVPTTITKKAEMQQWLRLRGISYDDNMLKPQLYYLIKLHKPKYKRYEIDELFNAKGHDVLRLPPYHPDLNPIELEPTIDIAIEKGIINLNDSDIETDSDYSNESDKPESDLSGIDELTDNVEEQAVENKNLTVDDDKTYLNL
ncbi:uncharacterized protein LOC126738106 [Anthonomus grandis grandis]|uniref:uncharacterized protein LOC126738106 n=1 Tax=Anthonomus grandis grandis TaxID=2921223 RepID=UPI00216691E3|nr:uncharacterized protein LOC126738106 [Anthonomus grandis grandis]